MNIKKLQIPSLFMMGLLYSVSNVQADVSTDPIASVFGSAPVFNGWTQFAYPFGALTGGTPDGIVGPGGGGQPFDTEYLFYKYDADTNDFSVGLQTGFDVEDGKVKYGTSDGGTVYDDASLFQGKAYYAGDLALSFATGNVNNGVIEGDASTYEYAVDFGLYTENYTAGDTVGGNTGTAGLDNAGLYEVSTWDNGIPYTQSSPFAMDDGTLLRSLSPTNNYSGTEGTVFDGLVSGIDGTYYRIVTFSLDDIITTAGNFTVDAHWTMSCGNDTINGRTFLTKNSDTPGVPEPSILALFGIGSVSMGFLGYRRRKNIA